MRKLVDDLERPLPDTIWWCENGHPDLLHRSSPLDFCMTCRDGACELRPTTVSGRRRRSRKFKGLVEQPTTVPKKVKLLPLPTGFALTEEQLETMREGRLPGIAFPKSLPGRNEDPGHLEIGARYRIDDDLSILVVGLVEEKFSFGVRYELLRNDEVVVTEQFNSHADAFPETHRRGYIDKQQQETHDGEPEPEPIEKGHVQRMTDDNRTARIEGLRASLKEAEGHVKALEERHPGKSRLFWPVNEEIKRLGKELSTEENVARDLPPVTSETVA